MEGMKKRKNKTSSKQKTLFQENENEKDFSQHFINIWKVALWGTNHDYILLQALNKYPSVGDVIRDRGWKGPKGGFNLSGPDEHKHFKWLDEAHYLNADNFTRYGVDEKHLEVLPNNKRYYRGGDPQTFKTPFVLFKRGQIQRRPGAAFSGVDFTYTTAMTGIAGPKQDSNLLKALTALLNSDLAQYFWFLASSSWGVEREEVTLGELNILPYPFLEEASNEQIPVIASLVDRLASLNIAQSKSVPRQYLESYETLFDFEEIGNQIITLERELNNRIFKCFQLSYEEIQLIQETVDYTISFFNSPEQSLALQMPSLDTRVFYATTYINSINFYLLPIGKKLTATVYANENAPLQAVSFSSQELNDKIPDIRISTPDEHMSQALLGLDKLNIEKFSKRMYHRRIFRIYDNEQDSFSIVKPAELRFWTTSAALSDAEETVTELLQPMKA